MASRMTWTMVGASCVDDSSWSVATLTSSYSSSLQCHNFGIQAFRRWVAFSILPATGKLKCPAPTCLATRKNKLSNLYEYGVYPALRPCLRVRCISCTKAMLKLDLAFLGTDVLQSLNELLLGAGKNSLL